MSLLSSCESGAYSAAILRKFLHRKWPLLALSLSQYRALFADITSEKRCGTPVLEKSPLLGTGREFS